MNNTFAVEAFRRRVLTDFPAHRIQYWQEPMAMRIEWALDFDGRTYETTLLLPPHLDAWKTLATWEHTVRSHIRREFAS